jgi:hypothetical protein
MTFKSKNPFYSGIIALAVLSFVSGCKDDEHTIKPPKNLSIFDKLDTFSGFDDYIGSPANAVRITFGSQLNKPTVIDGRNYRPVLEKVTLNDAQGTEIKGELIVSDDALSVSFFPDEILPENSDVRIFAVAHWEYESNGTWTAVSENGVELFVKTFRASLLFLPEAFGTVFPAPGATEQSVLQSARVSYNDKMGEFFASNALTASCRLAVDDVSLKKNNNAIQATVIQTDRFVEIAPKQFLEGQVTYTVAVDVHWERKQGTVWKPLLKNGAKITESKQFTFSTKTLGNTSQIIQDNIDYTYPIVNQYHFLPREHGNGFVKLRTGLQNELFSTIGVELKARFTTPGQDVLEVPVVFNTQNSTATYPIPDGLLNETIYKMEFARVSNSNAESETIFETHFRTSMYNTFEEKLNSFSFDYVYPWEFASGTSALRKIFDADEGAEKFDLAESQSESVVGVCCNIGRSKGTIRMEMLAEGNWYKEVVYPKVYSGYKNAGLHVSRDTSVIGVPPLNAVGIAQEDVSLSDEMIKANVAPRHTAFNLAWIMVPVVVHSDWTNFKNQAANYPANERNDYLNDLIVSSAPEVIPGNYVLRFKYVLPDGTETSQFTVTLQYKD